MIALLAILVQDPIAITGARSSTTNYSARLAFSCASTVGSNFPELELRISGPISGTKKPAYRVDSGTNLVSVRVSGRDGASIGYDEKIAPKDRHYGINASFRINATNNKYFATLYFNYEGGDDRNVAFDNAKLVRCASLNLYNMKDIVQGGIGDYPQRNAVAAYRFVCEARDVAIGL